MATQTRNPTSDVSFTGTWTGTAGSRWQSVDDHPDSGNPIADGLTHGTTTAGEGLFGFSVFSVPAGSVNISVQVLYYDFKNGSQASAIVARIRCNDTTGRNSPTGTHNPGNGNAAIALRTDNYPTNPKSAAAWTVNDVNGVGTNALTAFGVNGTDVNPSITISSIQLQVTYDPPLNGAGAGTIGFGQSASGGVLVQAAGSSTIAASGSAAGTVADPVIAGVGSGMIVFGQSADAGVLIVGAGSTTLVVSRSADGSVPIAGTATTPLSFGGGAQGVLPIGAAGAQVLPIIGAADGSVSGAGTGIEGDGSAVISFGGASAGSVQVGATGTMPLVLAGLGEGAVTETPVTGNANVALLPSGIADGSVAIQGDGAGEMAPTGEGTEFVTINIHVWRRIG